MTLNDSATALQGESQLMSMHQIFIHDMRVIMLASISRYRDAYKTPTV